MSNVDVSDTHPSPGPFTGNSRLAGMGSEQRFGLGVSTQKRRWSRWRKCHLAAWRTLTPRWGWICMCCEAIKRSVAGAKCAQIDISPSLANCQSFRRIPFLRLESSLYVSETRGRGTPVVEPGCVAVSNVVNSH